MAMRITNSKDVAMNRFALVMIPLAVFALATPSVAQQ